jgi:hypothetical protein
MKGERLLKTTALVTARKKRKIYIVVENIYYVHNERSLLGKWKL